MGKMYVSLFESKEKPNVSGTAEGDWEDFLKIFQSPLPSTIPKKSLGLWSPVRYRNNYKNDENVEEIYALTFDVDEDPIPTGEELRQHLKGLRTVVSTSSSATRRAPRWRVVFAISRPVSAEEYKLLWASVEARLPFPVGGQSKNVSRGWFQSRVGEDDYYEVFTTKGDPLNVETWLARAPEPEPEPELSTGDVGPLTPKREAKLKAAAAILGSAWPDKGRHTAQFALAGALYRESWSEESAFEFLCAVCRLAGDEDRAKRRGTISRTWTEGNAGRNITGWTELSRHIDPALVNNARELLKPESLAEAGKALGLGFDAPGLTVAQAVASAGERREEPVDRGSKLVFETDVWTEEPPETEFIVEGLIPKSCVAMWYGRADSLKTWMLFSLAIAIAKGEPWLGRATKKLKVGIVDYETGKVNVRRRLYMLRAGDTDGMLQTVSFPPGMKPNTAEFWGELAKHGFDVVFIDSLRKANSGGDENDSGEAIIPLEMAAEFSEYTACSVHYIHHAKKSTADGWPEFRGSAAIEDQVDCSFAVRKLETGDVGGKKTVDVKCEKPGDMRKPEPFAVEVEFNDSARLAVVRQGQVLPAAVEEEMSEERIRAQIRLILSDGPKVLTDIRKRVEGRHERIKLELQGMVQRGEVLRVGNEYMLDSDDDRRARVLEAVRTYSHWKSEAMISRGAHVTTLFVKKMVGEGLICRRAEGQPGYIVVER